MLANRKACLTTSSDFCAFWCINGRLKMPRRKSSRKSSRMRGKFDPAKPAPIPDKRLKYTELQFVVHYPINGHMV